MCGKCISRSNLDQILCKFWMIKGGQVEERVAMKLAQRVLMCKYLRNYLKFREKCSDRMNGIIGPPLILFLFSISAVPRRFRERWRRWEEMWWRWWQVLRRPEQRKEWRQEQRQGKIGRLQWCWNIISTAFVCLSLTLLYFKFKFKVHVQFH